MNVMRMPTRSVHGLTARAEAGPPGKCSGSGGATSASSTWCLLASLIACFTAMPAANAAYRIENVPLPAGLKGGIAAVGFTPGGTLVVSTRHGEIWMRRAAHGGWSRFATGLHEPLGLLAESEHVVYVAHRPELLRLADTDADGRADTFDVLGGDWGLTHNYHEFFFGLRRDQAGNFYGAVSLDSSGEKNPLPQSRGEWNREFVAGQAFHASEVPYRGWAVKITPDGRTVHFASGFRQPNGVGMSPEGELFVTDNQGDYKPSCGLLHVAEGDFHGHAESLKWEPGYEPGSRSLESLWRRYKPPAVVFPHGAMGLSSGEPVWDLTGGKFGPYSGQIFIGDYSNLVMRVGIEKVGGAWQGFVFPFLGRMELPPYVTGERLAGGSTRAAFAPDGSLYLGQTAGWGAGHDGLQRVTWDGDTPADVRSIGLTERGFALTFTKPMGRAPLARPESYRITRFRFYYHAKYGSPWIDEASVPAQEVRMNPASNRVELIIPGLVAGFVYEISMSDLRAQDGTPLANPVGYYTANRLVTGEVATGGTTRLAREGEINLGAKESAAGEDLDAEALIATGEKVYSLFCVACHQPDGRGLPGGAANFVDDKSRLAKSDAELMASITEGVETRGMPAFGSSLTPAQRRGVLAYVRAAFGGKPTAEK